MNSSCADMVDADIDVFFAQQLDPEANQMAAFTVPDPVDEAAFRHRWQRICNEPAIVVRTIVVGDAIVGHVLSYVHDGRPEVSYWLGKGYWGQGRYNSLSRHKSLCGGISS
jgi:RimJ/RimL family protein N-acetyltransferase